uniref:Uncharacterized protein n=1 Tax=Phage sp. ctGns7 TaxID=2828003 RepID=A0A8S5S8R3_9VIRU|nr:MAG TPA: hypothetical protein [Phage sp. ctGns7]
MLVIYLYSYTLKSGKLYLTKAHEVSYNTLLIKLYYKTYQKL